MKPLLIKCWGCYNRRIDRWLGHVNPSMPPYTYRTRREAREEAKLLNEIVEPKGRYIARRLTISS